MDELARAAAQTAHDRLDGINGQIGKIHDRLTPMGNDVASLKTMAKIGGAVALALLVATLSLVVAVVTRQAPAPSNATQRVEKATGRYTATERLAGRERGAHGRLGGP